MLMIIITPIGPMILIARDIKEGDQVRLSTTFLDRDSECRIH